MAQLRTTTTKRQSFSAGPVGKTSTFGASKFFLKKQNHAASKIQALFRAFLVQARLYRQRVLEPRRQELKHCAARKAEELQRIQQQKEEEVQTLPATVRKEMEAAVEEAASLRESIDYYTKSNEDLRKDRQELKRANKKLELESRQLKDRDFSMSVANMRKTKENEELLTSFAKYQYAIEDGQEQNDEMQEALSKASRQREILRKCVSKIIKMVEEKANSNRSPPSSPKQRRKSPTRSDVTRSVSPPNSPRQQRKAAKRSSKKRSSIKGHPGDASFNWATKSVSNLGVDLDLDMSFSQRQLDDQPDQQACFDWATRSYNWANQSNNGILDESSSRRHRRQSKIKTLEEERERHPRRPSMHSSAKGGGNAAMKELLQELKAIKKHCMKW